MKKGKLKQEDVVKISIVAKEILAKAEIKKMLAEITKKKRRMSN